jgi:hypothetical protein
MFEIIYVKRWKIYYNYIQYTAVQCTDNIVEYYVQINKTVIVQRKAELCNYIVYGRNEHHRK